jgi:uncharacterized protein YndB with AHSA1/START domain
MSEPRAGEHASPAPEIHTARTFPAPCQTLFAAFADPAVLAAVLGLPPGRAPRADLGSTSSAPRDP